MKLETTILPRRDGKVSAELGGITYEFAKDEQGRLVADVGDEAHIALLLNTGNFIPADDADFESAAAIAGAGAEDGEADDEGEDEDEDLADDVPALPVEENTPPSSRKPRKAK